MLEYDLIADWYAAGRERSEIGVPEVMALARTLPPGAAVLDVGCGSGIPITRALRRAGCQVTAIDSSERMVELFRANVPDVPVLHCDIQSCDFGGRTFDAAVAWGVLFHLSHDDQRRAIGAIARALRPGAAFLFTSGHEHGARKGMMNDVQFGYFSFSEEEYRRLLHAHALDLIDVHADEGENWYYLAFKRRQEPGGNEGPASR